MCEVLIRLENKTDNPKSFSRGDAIDLFDDGRFPDVVKYPHAVIKIPGYPKSNLQFLLTPHMIYNPETKDMDIIRVRLYFIDASVIAPTLVDKLRRDRVITVDPIYISGSIRNRATGEIYNG